MSTVEPRSLWLVYQLYQVPCQPSCSPDPPSSPVNATESGMT